MGSRNLDRISVTEWRHKCPTVADMWRGGWKVRAFCETCELELQVNLDTLIRAGGPAVVLWDRTTPCKRVGCVGRMFFKGYPPGANGFGFLGKIPRLRQPSRDPLAFGAVALVDPDAPEAGPWTDRLGPPPPDPS